ncbi:protein of unknown function [Paraburkholderia kururiensis]
MQEQCYGMPGDGLRTDLATRGQIAPLLRRGKRQHRQPEQRQKHERGFECAVEPPFPLPAPDCDERRLAVRVAEAFVHALAQHAAFADHLAHPEWREPRVLIGDFDEQQREVGERCDRIVGMVAERLAELRAKRHEALVDQHVDQLVARVEVVMDHRRRHTGLAGNGAQRGFEDALPREQPKRHFEQFLALLRAPGAARRPARAARRVIVPQLLASRGQGLGAIAPIAGIGPDGRTRRAVSDVQRGLRASCSILFRF